MVRTMVLVAVLSVALAYTAATAIAHNLGGSYHVFTGEICVRHDNFLTHPVPGGQSSVQVVAQASALLELKCGLQASVDPYWLSLQRIWMRWNSSLGQWRWCADTGQMRNLTRTSALWHERRWSSPACGSGYYQQLEVGWVWNGWTWRGGESYVGFHWLPA